MRKLPILYSTLLKEIEKQVKPMKKELRIRQTAQTKARQDYNTTKNEATYQDLQYARVMVRELRRELYDPEATIRRLRKECYKWNKISKAPSSNGFSQTVNMTTPTSDHRTVEDDKKHIDISKLRSACSQDGKTIVYSSTDYGVRVMSGTVPMIEENFLDNMKYFHSQSDPTVKIPDRLRHIP